MIRTHDRSRTAIRWAVVIAVLLGAALAVKLHDSGPADGTDAAAISGAAGPEVMPTNSSSTDWRGLTIVPLRVDRDDYRRDAFGEPWTDACTTAGCGNSCDTRNDILARDLVDIVYGDSRNCDDHTVLSGVLHDPYSGATIDFLRGADTSAEVQIDHLIPLAAAWDLGAWSWTPQQRVDFANDPANLLAVAGSANRTKSDSLPGTTPGRQGHDWMPPNSAYHCTYALELIAVAGKYQLPLDEASVPVLDAALATCPPG